MKARTSAPWQLTATVLMLAHVQERVQPWRQLDELCEQYTLFAGTACDVRASDDFTHHDSPFRTAAFSSWESNDEFVFISNDARLSSVDGAHALGLTPQRRALNPSHASASLKGCTENGIT
jgi:hypothetical protein